MTIRKILSASLLALTLLASGTLAAKDDPRVGAFNQRLDALEADSQTADLARYERLEARQAVQALADAKHRDEDLAAYVADRRVQIAEIAARTEVARRQAEKLEDKRSQLLIEASQREATRARQEAEKLRIQAQIQAEEAEQLRQQAEADALARQDAEDALSSVAGRQAAKVSAAQKKAAQLAHQEAELTADAKLPPSKFEARGEVFTIADSAFASGNASLNSSASGPLKALATYLNIGKKGRVRLLGYAGSSKAAKARADAVSDALIAAGVSSTRLQASAGKGAGSKRKAVEVVILP